MAWSMHCLYHVVLPEPCITRDKFIDFVCIFTTVFPYKRNTGPICLGFHFIISLLFSSKGNNALFNLLITSIQYFLFIPCQRIRLIGLPVYFKTALRIIAIHGIGRGVSNVQDR